MSKVSLTRRSAFFAAGAGAAALAATSLVGGAAAAEMNDMEKANVKLVNEFLSGWGKADVPAAKLGEYLADDFVFRLSEKAVPVKGKAAAVEAFGGFFKRARISIVVLESFAKGPVVTNSRVDGAIVDGKVQNPLPYVGMFVVHDGKITEWSDFSASAPPPKGG